MIDEILYYRSKGYDPYTNQGVEMYLFDEVKDNQLAFYLWQNDKTVVIGRNQNASVELDRETLEADGGHLARRLSGGGAVYHEVANLNFTFACTGDNYSVARQSMVIVRAMKKLGFDAELSGRNDITIDGAKFSGNAYYSKANHHYHHGTILVNVDTEKMAKYLKPSSKKLKAKGVSSVRSRVVNLVQLDPDLTIDGLASALKEAVKEEYQCSMRELSESDFDTEKLDRQVAFFADKSWQRGKHVDYNLFNQERYSWGEASIEIELSENKIKDLKVNSDANDSSLIKEIEEILLRAGTKLDDLVRALDDTYLKDEQSNLIKQDIADLIKALEEGGSDE